MTLVSPLGQQPFPDPMGLEQTLLPPTSRYHGLPIRTFKRKDGKKVPYINRRFLPQPTRFATLTEHVVSTGERLDQIAAEYLGDPEQFWRIADANAAVSPFQLTEEAGTRLRITLPEGIPGPPHA